MGDIRIRTMDWFTLLRLSHLTTVAGTDVATAGVPGGSPSIHVAATGAVVRSGRGWDCRV